MIYIRDCSKKKKKNYIRDTVEKNDIRNVTEFTSF
jgi:hypothetical protein